MRFETADSMELQARPESVALARRFITERVSGPRADDAMLVVSELVTNALLHSHGTLRLTSVRRGPEISIEVWDGDARSLPMPRDPRSGQPGGRGLRIVESLCEAWGHRQDPPGKTVWATINLT